MASREYVSVSSQRDVEEARLAAERKKIAADPQGELEELTRLLHARSIAQELARKVAVQLSEQDVLTVHARLEFGIDPATVSNPWAAAFASILAFGAGGLIPFLATLPAPSARGMWVSGAAVLFALALTGWISAKLGDAPDGPPSDATCLGGLLAMIVTFAVGRMAGTQL